MISAAISEGRCLAGQQSIEADGWRDRGGGNQQQCGREPHGGKHVPAWSTEVSRSSWTSREPVCAAARAAPQPRKILAAAPSTAAEMTSCANAAFVAGPYPKAWLKGATCGQDERWLADLATELSMLIATLHRGQRVGWLTSRQVAGARGRWAIYADAEELQRLRTLRDTPRG